MSTSFLLCRLLSQLGLSLSQSVTFHLLVSGLHQRFLAISPSPVHRLSIVLHLFQPIGLRSGLPPVKLRTVLVSPIEQVSISVNCTFNQTSNLFEQSWSKKLKQSEIRRAFRSLNQFYFFPQKGIFLFILCLGKKILKLYL